MTKRTTKLSEQIGVRLTPEEFAEVEAWRREQQPVIPSRPAAVRELMRKGLAADRRSAKDRKKQ